MNTKISNKKFVIFYSLVSIYYFTNITANEYSNTNNAQDLKRDFSISYPNTDTPFFVEREEAKNALKEQEKWYFVNPATHHMISPLKRISNLYEKCFKIFSKKNEHSLFLEIEPSEISVKNTGEIKIFLKIINQGKQVIELLFPSQQRIEILIRDQNGNIVKKWSQDRSFEPIEEFVTINPKEFISYSETMDTKSLHAYQKYTIEVFLMGQMGYRTTQIVNTVP